MGKIEKEYMRIDKLSTFVTTDMKIDACVADAIKRMGLGYPFDLDP